MLLCAACAFVGAADGAEDAARNRAARALLRQVAEAYRGLRTYDTAIRLQRVVESPLGKQETVTRGRIALRRPNKLYVELTHGENRFVYASDGKRGAAYYSPTERRASWEAEEEFDRTLTHPLLLFMLGEVSRAALVPLTSRAYEFMLRDAEGVELLPPGPEDPPGTRRVRIRLGSHHLDMWVDGTTHMLPRARAVLKGTLTKRAEETDDAKALGEMTVTFTLSQEPLDPKSPDYRKPDFSFKPPGDGPEARSAPELFKPPPLMELVDFRMPGLQKGETVQLSEHRGEVIALDFWATWCVPARDELKMLQRFKESYGDRGFQVIAVNVGDAREEAARWMEEQGVDVPVALDANHRVAARYGVTAFPTLFLIGRDGKIQTRYTGHTPALEEQLADQIEDLLAGKSLQ